MSIESSCIDEFDHDIIDCKPFFLYFSNIAVYLLPRICIK